MPAQILIRYIIVIFFGLAALQLEAQEKFENDTSAAFKYIRERGEVYFSFEASTADVRRLSRIVSVDSYRDGIAFAYAGEKEFAAFLEESLRFTIYSPPGEWHREKPKVKGAWDYYPTYSEYKAMMQAWAGEYPHLSEYFDAGDSTEGRKILFLRITGNKSTGEPKPLFMYSSTMHGDETTGFVLMLRLIEHLLENYPGDPQVERLMDNLEIWINPLANPDGTYFGGDGNEIISPKRFNANNVDLNRDFPGAGLSETPSGEREAETIAMMELMGSRQFILSANIHDGTEVMNYPWDIMEERHADDGWFEYISREYADTAQHYSPQNYMTFLGGVTNGYDWYPISGGRQDYVTWYTRGREITMEISDIKNPPPGMLPDYWEYNRRSLLNYMEQAMFGIKGRVSNAVTGEPLRAKVELLDYDAAYSHIYSGPSDGWFFRLVEQGMYNVLVSADGFINDTSDVQVWDREAARLDIELVPQYTITPLTGSRDDTSPAIYYSAAGREIIAGIDIESPSILNLALYDRVGRKIRTLHSGWVDEGYTRLSFGTSGLKPGIYIVLLNSGHYLEAHKVLIME